MKARTMLYTLIAIALLLPLGAWQVLAEEDAVPMWVHRARIAYTGRSSTGPDAVVAMIHIRDATLDMVAGASVEGVWTLPDGSTSEVQTLTNLQGIAVFSLWQGRGDYRICVTAVTKEGRVYDPTLDREQCPVFTVW